MKIQWNTVTWYSKSLALILFAALPFIGFYYGMQYQKMVAPSSRPMVTENTAITTDYYNNPAEWQIDSNNTSGGFSIAYPIDFDTQDNYSVVPSTDWRIDANNGPGIKYFTLTVPKAFEPHTNFSDARLTVGAGRSDIAIAQCIIPDQTGGPMTATSSVIINGIPFTVFHFSDAGAGNYYETTSYRTLHAGQCYAIEYTIHSSQIMNYPSSYNIQPFDASKIKSLMQSIVETFKFL